MQPRAAYIRAYLETGARRAKTRRRVQGMGKILNETQQNLRAADKLVFRENCGLKLPADRGKRKFSIGSILTSFWTFVKSSTVMPFLVMELWEEKSTSFGEVGEKKIATHESLTFCFIFWTMRCRSNNEIITRGYCTIKCKM